MNSKSIYDEINLREIWNELEVNLKQIWSKCELNLKFIGNALIAI